MTEPFGSIIAVHKTGDFSAAVRYVTADTARRTGERLD
jgi:hypothetical protein